MKTIYKYPLQIGKVNEVQLPVNRALAHVGIDPRTHNPCLWFIVENVSHEEIAKYYIYGTGWDVPEKSFHVGSVIIGNFVWHIFKE